MTFNPNQPCIPNGNIFSFQCTPEEAKIIIVPLPWDVTASYKKGAALGPDAILKASLQLDFFDPDFPNAWEIPVFMLPIQKELLTLNEDLKRISEPFINLETNSKTSEHQLFLLNSNIENFHNQNYHLAKTILNQNKKVAFVGGEHSVAYGLLKALAEQTQFSILHIDAHADLRKAYTGIEHSHASIMYNVSQLESVNRIVHVAIRDYCIEESELIQQNSEKHKLFSDRYISDALFSGKNWETLCSSIIEQLTDTVYVSFDIDGLEPAYCPNTGTPVPGGLSYNQAVYLLKMLKKSGKKVIGFDLCEVAPNPVNPADEWDGNVGARVLLELLKLLV